MKTAIAFTNIATSAGTTPTPGRRVHRRESLVAGLLGRPSLSDAAGDPARPLLASLLTGRALGEGVLPASLGLDATALEKLWQLYFPGPPIELTDGCREEIPELSDLVSMLLDYRAGARESEVWFAHIIAWGCAGRDHLWQDLGLANRVELSAIMATAFPTLAASNIGDMKWKKFLYRHYCQRDGIYVCPAPSCSECIDYAKCFAPED